MEMLYENLAQAIIVMACNDYRKACKKLKKDKWDIDARHEKRECLKFFRSDYFDRLTSLDGEQLIYMLDKELGLV